MKHFLKLRNKIIENKKIKSSVSCVHYETFSDIRDVVIMKMRFVNVKLCLDPRKCFIILLKGLSFSRHVNNNHNIMIKNYPRKTMKIEQKNLAK